MNAVDKVGDATRVANAVDKLNDSGKVANAVDKATDTGKAVVKSADCEVIRNSAQVIRNSGGESIAGHTLQKHAGRHPHIWEPVKGSSSQINEQAMKHLDEIIAASVISKQCLVIEVCAF